MIWWLVSRTPLISGCSQSCDLIFYWMLHDPKQGQMIFKMQINQTLDWWRSTAEGRACWCSPSCRPPPTKAGVCTCACPLVLLCNVPFLPAMLNLFCFMSRYNSLKKKTLNHLFCLRCCGRRPTLPHSWWIPTRWLQNREHPCLIRCVLRHEKLNLNALLCVLQTASPDFPSPSAAFCT